MASMQELLAKLRTNTANPATANPAINPEAAHKEEAVKNPEPRKETKLGFELQEKLLSLENMLLEKHPAMPNLLREIHIALRKQPENVILMNEDELHILVEGLEKQTGIELASLGVKSSKTASSKARAAKVSASDL